MAQFDDKDQRAKKIYKRKTFSVPFTLGEIKNNISISTNTPLKPFKKKIINQAIKFHIEGNISEAVKLYQYFIDQGFNDHKVFSNYGVILQKQGKLKEAEILYQKAIKINPNFADAHLNLGSTLKDLGKLKKAELSTRKAIELNPNLADAHLNLGSILKDLGKLQKAELSTRKAIEIQPNFADAHLNLGNILKDLGKLKKAELSTRKAIEIQPNFADAHLNLGSILKDLGKLQKAESSTRKAIELNPNFADPHLNLGIILRDLDKIKESFDSYLRVIEINPTYPNIYSYITELLKDSDLSQLNKSDLKNILNRLLEKDNVSHNELFKAFNFLYHNKIISNLEKLDSDYSKNELIYNNKLIINALKKIIFSDVKLEKVLTKIRRYICKRIANNKENTYYSELEFIIALGEQCFLNEYIYSLTKEEEVFLDIISKRCQDNELNEINISVLSCYSPLYKLLDRIPSLKSFNSSNQSFKELIELQIIEPLQEIELSQNIKKIGNINDDISQKVKSQYEENPYPRWRYKHHLERQKISIVQGINENIYPNSIDHNGVNDQLKVLVAGCGTGQHILNTQRYKNVQITCIDLSLASLAYAQRKINELGIDNVELIQMDILEVNLLKEKFDIIECSGVLHHMNNPSKGLTALVSVLNNNGFLKLGLYSELARQDIISARKYISNNKLQSNKDNIRGFRETIFSGKIPELNSLLKSRDLYTLSSCRDLCFHIKEHRFTIKQFTKTLQSNKLKFLGFLLQQPIKSLYKEYFPDDKKQTNLQNWEKFEEQHPTTFAGMYQFWVSKL